MKLLFFTEARLGQTPDKKFYSNDQSFSYQIFKRYLKFFDSVLIVARSSVISHDAINEDTRVDNKDVKVLPLPHYIGPFQYLIKRNNLIKTLRNYIDANSDATIICRVPGMIGTTAAKYLIPKNRPYGVEVVGDPQDVFAPGSFNHPLRPVFRHRVAKDLRAVVKGAAASIYVTKETLQLRYPPANNSFSTYASDVMLPPEAFVMEAKVLRKSPPFSIVTVGTLAAMYKSPDIAIAALSILKQKELSVSLQWLGDGGYRPAMIALAKKTGISDRVSFVGNVASAAEVRRYLDKADLFVLPSRTEGLPRALVEAMARGLPCIGTEVGGIPELLDKQALIPINNAELLAEKIDRFLNTPGLADAQAKRNLSEAKNYAFENLEARRMEFYQYMKGIS